MDETLKSVVKKSFKRYILSPLLWGRLWMDSTTGCMLSTLIQSRLAHILMVSSKSGYSFGDKGLLYGSLLMNIISKVELWIEKSEKTLFGIEVDRFYEDEGSL